MTETRDTISLEALKAGDRNEFARLVETFTNPIYRLALNMLGREQDAEDVLQETFIKVFKNVRDFEERSNLSTWIYRIAVNEALMILRKDKHKAASLDEPDPADEVDEPRELVDWCCQPEKTFMSEEVQHQLQKAIKLLPEKLRVVFVLRDMEDLSIRETAQALSISEMSVKTRLLRARLKLRETLSQYFVEMQTRQESTR
jgi:RNA polymerase sigma-70 factor, ECF subfamily